MQTNTKLLIIGAGPFGLALSAYAKHLGIEHLIIGKPMEFWKSNMPAGMLLRSSCNWHFDPNGIYTIDAFIAEHNSNCQSVEPLSLSFYLEYAQWFIERNKIEVEETYVTQLDKTSMGYSAITEDGNVITAQKVVLATGLKYFKHLPADITSLLPANSFVHTCDATDIEAFNGKRVLIIGGRQSAFEWAALLQEAGASSIHISHRHDTPAFTRADWSWATKLFAQTGSNPSWFRRLSMQEKEAITKQLWSEGRLKLEPWLAARIAKPNVHIWPNTTITHALRTENGELEISLSNGQFFGIDAIILATGYKPQIHLVPYLAKGNLLALLQLENGLPLLNEHFESNIPGLYFTGMPASLSFGPFFGFMLAVEASTKILGEALLQH